MSLSMLLVAALCQDPGESAPNPPRADEDGWTFTDVAPACGIEFRHRFGRENFRCILEDTGAGVALIDYDGDGLLDVYLVNGGWVEGVHGADETGQRGATNRLYRNLGGMEFRDVTAVTGVGDASFGMGAAVGDYDGDGDEDLYVLNFGANVLYRNDGGRSFTDVTAEMGVAGPPMLNGAVKWSVSGAFFDADRDGDLDLYVANYLAFDPEASPEPAPGEPYPGPEAYRAQRSVLYRNEGDHFADATEELGLLAHVKSMGISVADLDEDGLPDLFEAGDTVPNAAFRQGADGRWTEVGMLAGLAFDGGGGTMSAMHASIGDYDGDGRLDLFVPTLHHGCLYRNHGDFRFAETSGPAGLTRALRGLSGWGSQLADFDLDGDLDALVVTGGAFDCEDAQPAQLLENDGRGFFSAMEGLGLGEMVGRGAAFGDLDGDGDVDFVVNRKDRGGLASVMRNDLPPGKSWLLLDLVGTRSNREAIGARISLTAGGKRMIREVQRGNSYLSQDDRRAHFGLGDAESVESLVVRWPSGLRQAVDVAELGPLNRVVRIVEPLE